MKRILFFTLGLMLAAPSGFAFSSYVSRIPNGTVNSCVNCHGPLGPPNFSPFGTAFVANNFTWNTALNQMRDVMSVSNGALTIQRGTEQPGPSTNATLPYAK